MSRLFALFSLACAALSSTFVPSAFAAGRAAQPMVQVMVQLKGAPLAADANLKARTRATLHRFRLDATLPSARWYSSALVQYQNNEVSYLRQHGVQIRLDRQFHVLFNGFSATIPVSEEGTLRRLVNVDGVLPIKQYRPLIDGSVNLVHATEAWSQVGSPSNAGRNLMIANIDTGIDIKNPCFNDAGYAPPPLGRRSDNPADLTLTNNKVIVARAFGSDPTAPYSAADSQGHGTFNAAIEACDYNTVTPIGTHMSGMAPAAYLMNYNVFVDNGGTTTDSNILAGVEAALLDGADVANISIGGPAGDPSLDFESQELNLASKAGLTMVVAAGNDGPSTQTVSSPGVAASAIAVGATTNSRGIFSSASITGVDGIPSQLTHMRANQGHAFTTPIGPAQMVPVGLGRLPQDDPNDLTANDFAGKDLHGKIALIQRGIVTFEKKINNAAAAGAIGALIYDNVPEVSLLHMATASATLPSMSISQADGQVLVAFLQSHPNAQVTFDPTLSGADETPNLLSDFSSRGYAADYNIKPDLVAPGEDIYSATEAQDPAGSQYDPSGFMSGSGTSFSSPHVAGAAALVLQKHPTWTPEQVKAALVENANPSVVVDPQTKGAPSVTQMGGGLLDANAALSTTAYATPTSITFGEINVASGAVKQTTTLTMNDAGGGSGSWSVAVKSFGATSNAFALSAPASVTVPTSGHATLSLALSVSAAAANNDFSGYVVLTHGSETLHVPYFAHVVNGPVKPNTVLLVDASTSRYVPDAPFPAPVHKDVTKYYTDALTAIGQPYTYWNEATLGAPSFTDMKNSSAVIYFTGSNLGAFSGNNSEAFQGPLTGLDTSALHAYVDAGGHVFVSGEGAAASDTAWALVVLGAEDAGLSTYDNSTNDKNSVGGISPPQPSAIPDVRFGVRSNPYIFGGLKAIDFSTKGDGAGTNTAVKSTPFGDMFGVNGLKPFFGSAAPFGNAYGSAALRTTDLAAAEGGADVAIVSSDEPTLSHKATFAGRTVVFSFGFEGINDNTGYATRAQVLQRIFHWFGDRPSATIVSAHYAAHRSVQLKASLHAGAGINPVAYAWQIGSVKLKVTAKPTNYTFPRAGTYKLRVLVTDSLGHMAVSSVKSIKVG
jgi:minor extracellular serine protease Vpr